MVRQVSPRASPSTLLGQAPWSANAGAVACVLPPLLARRRHDPRMGPQPTLAARCRKPWLRCRQVLACCGPGFCKGPAASCCPATSCRSSSAPGARRVAGTMPTAGGSRGRGTGARRQTRGPRPEKGTSGGGGGRRRDGGAAVRGAWASEARRGAEEGARRRPAERQQGGRERGETGREGQRGRVSGNREREREAGTRKPCSNQSITEKGRAQQRTTNAEHTGEGASSRGEMTQRPEGAPLRDMNGGEAQSMWEETRQNLRTTRGRWEVRVRQESQGERSWEMGLE